MPLRNVAELSPVAQVVVYAIMPSGVVVTDSLDFPIQLCLKNKVGLSQSVSVHVGLSLLHRCSINSPVEMYTWSQCMCSVFGMLGVYLPCVQVSLQFASSQELPGEGTSFRLTAHPGSLCSVRAIDQSVLLLQPEEELSIKSVPYCSHLTTHSEQGLKLTVFGCIRSRNCLCDLKIYLESICCLCK